MDADWDGSPQLLIGDLNGGLDADACKELVRWEGSPSDPLRIRTAWEEAEECIGPHDTCEGGVGLGPCPGRTDHVMFRPGLRVPQVITVEDGDGKPAPSDHLAVVADFDLAAMDSRRLPAEHPEARVRGRTA